MIRYRKEMMNSQDNKRRLKDKNVRANNYNEWKDFILKRKLDFNKEI